MACRLADFTLYLPTPPKMAIARGRWTVFQGRHCLSVVHRRRHCPIIFSSKKLIKVVRASVTPISPSLLANDIQISDMCKNYGFMKIGKAVPDNVTLKDIITTLPKKVFEIDDIKAWRSVLLSVVSYAMGILMIAKAPWYLLPLAWAWTGTAVTGFFVVGHDCAHRSFSRNKLLEDVVGTLAFLPLIYPYEPWRFKHDKHHAKTNMLLEDTAWHPILKEDIAESPLLRKALIFGYGPLRPLMSITHWLMWHFDLKKFKPNEVGRVKISLACVFAFILIGWPLIIFKAGIVGWIKFWLMPWLVYHFWMSTFTMVHHTAPHIPFKASDEWNAAQAQLNGTVHCNYPRWVEILCHDINVHIPHHISPRIPSYNLREAHGSLQENWGKQSHSSGQVFSTSTGLFEQMLRQLGDHSVEFQLPHWLKQQKSSMPYTFIKRNIYLTKRIKRRAEDDGIFCSCAPSAGLSAVCDRDCLCGMLLSSCSKSCQCGALCINKPFQYRPMKKMKLVTTEKCGSGLVTDEDMKQGDFVIEYVGEVIDDKTCEERLWKMKHCGETNFYLCEINRDMVIDASYKGNKSRFINHSCQPNTEMQKWTIDGETRIGIFATRDIEKGEELTYDYQFVQFGADQNCYCGAKGCRQKLGSRPSKLKFSSDAALQLVLYEMAASSPAKNAVFHEKYDYASGKSSMGNSHSFISFKKKTTSQNCIWEVVRIWCPRNKRYFGGVIVEFNSHTRRHIILREDGELQNLDMSKEDWELL